MNKKDLEKLISQQFCEHQNRNAMFPLKEIHMEYLEMLRYPLEAGGKRLRPLLCHSTAELFGYQGTQRQDLELLQQVGLAIECVHTYSLVHDDLPCMDNDSLRRGKPTLHTIVGEGKAVLVGDALLNHAFELIFNLDSGFTYSQGFLSRLQVSLGKILSSASGSQGLIWGQWCDLSMEKTWQVVTHQEELKKILTCIHTGKTGALFGASLGCGFLLALFQKCSQMTDEPKAFSLYQKAQILLPTMERMGHLFGIAFQLQDDLLDVTSSFETLGKTPGKDLQSQKLNLFACCDLEEGKKWIQALKNEAFLSMKKTLADWKEMVNLCPADSTGGMEKPHLGLDGWEREISAWF